MGEGSGRGSGRVGSDFLSASAGRVGSGQRFAGSGRVGSKKSDPWTTLSQIHCTSSKQSRYKLKVSLIQAQSKPDTSPMQSRYAQSKPETSPMQSRYKLKTSKKQAQTRMKFIVSFQIQASNESLTCA